MYIPCNLFYSGLSSMGADYIQRQGKGMKK